MAAFNATTLLLIFSANILTTYMIKQSLSQQLLEENRNNIISADFRALLTSLKLRTKGDFVAISIWSDDGKLLNEFARQADEGRPAAAANIIACGKFEYDIFYDDQHTVPFGKIMFIYERITSLGLMFAAWLVLVFLSLPASFPVNLYLRSKIARDMERHRLMTIAQTTQMIAHDLKNPINTIQDALNCSDWEEFCRRSASFKSALYRLLSMVDSLRQANLDSLVHARPTGLPWDQIIAEMQPIARERGVQLHLNQVVTGQMTVDPNKIQRAIINLLRNAVESGSRKVWLGAVANGTDVAIEILDDGPGVPDAIKSQIFERGVTSGKKEGTGLGLHFVQSVGHGGESSYARENGVSIFRIALPKAASELVLIPDQKPLSASGRRPETTVDDSGIADGGTSKIAIMLKNGETERLVSTMIAGQLSSHHIVNDRERIGEVTILFTDDEALVAAAMEYDIAIVPIDGEASLDRIIQLILDQFI